MGGPIGFLFGSLLASAAFYTYIFMNPGYVGRVGATELLYPLRHIFLFAPVMDESGDFDDGGKPMNIVQIVA